MGQKGNVIWLTGLSGAGKTTISKIVESHLKAERNLRVQLLDGDILRELISQELNFSKKDRIIQIKRAIFIAKLLADQDVIVIASFITPYQEMRNDCRQHLSNYYIEVFVKCPISECIIRDVKGLYKRALEGEIKDFTGISDPFEEPLSPDFILDTLIDTPEESASRLISFLEDRGIIPPIRNVSK